jgi:RNA polymerase-binding transcription factor DksA
MLSNNKREIIEKTSDVSDAASIFEAKQMQSIMKNHQDLMNKPLNPSFDGVHCINCDTIIPPKRLEAIKTDRCVQCAGFSRKNC